MAFSAPNIKGPRFRKNTKHILTLDMYKNFIKSHLKYKDLTFDQFTTCVNLCSQKMWKASIDERDGVELPIGGTIFIASAKITKKHNYDIQASIAANTPIKHRNYDTDGYSAKICYSPRLAKISGRDKSIWLFRGVREYKRAISKQYPKNWKKYIMIEDMYNIVKNYKKARSKHYFAESTERAVQTYNEFDLN